MNEAVFPVEKIELPRVKDEAWAQLFSPEGEIHHPFPFQARMTEHVKQLRSNGGGFILLYLPTGSGKTRGIITPALQLRENLIAVYPTNALIADQRRQIEADAIRHSFEVHAIDRHYVTQVKIEKNFNTKSRALYHLLITEELGKSKKILLINPDILNLIRHGRYGRLSQQQLYEILTNYPLIAFDELHTYDVKQLASILHFAHWVLAQQPYVFIFSTATMPERVREMLKNPCIEENFDKQKVEVSIEPAQVLSPMDLMVAPVTQWGGAEWAESHLEDIKKWETQGGCVVIFDSIGECLSTYTALREHLDASQVGLVIGAVDKKSRKTEIVKPIVVGNNAIRVGIDFTKRNAVVYAFSAADALQGLGRVGRGKSLEVANAILLAPTRTAEVLNNYREKLLRSYGGKLSREQLADCLIRVFPCYEDFNSYLKRFASIEAWLAENETWCPEEDLVERLFGTSRQETEADFSRFQQSECLQQALITFRGDTDLGIAVKDSLMEQHGYFPFRIENPYRVFRYCTVIKNYSPRDFAKLVKSDTDIGKQFLIDLEERKNYLLGYAEIEWTNKKRRVSMTCREPNIWQWHNKPCWVVCNCKTCFTWQFCVDSRDNRLVYLRNTMNKHLTEHKIPFIVFNPNQIGINLPPLFCHYLVYTQQQNQNLHVVFGGNALLMSSLILAK